MARDGGRSWNTGSVCPSSGTTTTCVPSAEKRRAATCARGDGSHSAITSGLSVRSRSSGRRSTTVTYALLTGGAGVDDDEYASPRRYASSDISTLARLDGALRDWKGPSGGAIGVVVEAGPVMRERAAVIAMPPSERMPLSTLVPILEPTRNAAALRSAWLRVVDVEEPGFGSRRGGVDANARSRWESARTGRGSWSGGGASGSMLGTSTLVSCGLLFVGRGRKNGTSEDADITCKTEYVQADTIVIVDGFEVLCRQGLVVFVHGYKATLTRAMK